MNFRAALHGLARTFDNSGSSDISQKRLPIFRLILAVLLLVTAIIAGKAWQDTFGPAVVRRTSVELEGFSSAQRPITIALISDLHVGGPVMPPERVSRIVSQINALRPDIVMIAGDIMADGKAVSEAYTLEQAIEPLGALEAPLGVIAVSGNHDHARGLPAMQAIMQANGIVLLTNRTLAAGPVSVAGVDEIAGGEAAVAGVIQQLEAMPGGRIVLAHNPDLFALVPSSASLTVAGHTHCGQIALPWGYAPVTPSRFDQRYNCGRVDEAGKTLVVTAGLGACVLPLRLFAPADIWLIEARPPDDSASDGLPSKQL